MFTNPIGLLALLALPTVLALHWFRRRFRERTVAGLFLFPREALVADAGRTRTTLLRSWSLLLELLAALVLALVFSGLTCGARDTAKHLVVVLDHSASMSAKGISRTIVEKAREVVRARMKALGRDALVTLIASGAHPEIVVGPNATQGEAEGYLEHFAPQSPSHDISIALDLARDLAEDGDEILLVTDDPAFAPPGIDVEAVGESLGNVAIVNARRTREDGKEQLVFDLRAFSDSPRSGQYRIRTLDGAELLAQPWELAADGSRSFALELPTGTPEIELTLDEDELALDDRAILLPEPLGIVNVALLLDEETKAALELERALGAVDRVARVSDPAAANLVFATAPGELRAWQTEVDIKSKPSSSTPDAVSDWIGPFLLERRHPLLDGVLLEGVVWSAPDGALPGIPLILAGDQPLMSESVEGTAVRIHLAVVGESSNLPNAPDWPILLSNVVRGARTRLPGLERVNLTLGESIEFRRPSGDALDAGIEIRGPDGSEHPVRGAMIASFVPTQVGVHSVQVEGAERGRVAVRFLDPSESDLRRRGSASVQAADTATHDLESDVSGRLELRILALIALLAVLLDSFVLTRRTGAP